MNYRLRRDIWVTIHYGTSQMNRGILLKRGTELEKVYVDYPYYRLPLGIEGEYHDYTFTAEEVESNFKYFVGDDEPIPSEAEEELERTAET